MRPITNFKRDASLNVGVQKLDSVEVLTLRISATRSRHEMTNLERLSLMDSLTLRWTVCALLKHVDSSANVPLSPRRGDEISPLFQPVFFLLNFLGIDKFFQSPQLCLVDSTSSNFSCVAQ